MPLRSVLDSFQKRRKRAKYPPARLWIYLIVSSTDIGSFSDVPSIDKGILRWISRGFERVERSKSQTSSGGGVAHSDFCCRFMNGLFMEKYKTGHFFKSPFPVGMMDEIIVALGFLAALQLRRVRYLQYPLQAVVVKMSLKNYFLRYIWL